MVGRKRAIWQVFSKNWQIVPLMGDYQPDDDDLAYAFYWESQVIYGWEQTFGANAITHIKHEYKPLVGNSY